LPWNLAFEEGYYCRWGFDVPNSTIFPKKEGNEWNFREKRHFGMGTNL
jgi:hypothetical protein